MKDYFSVISWKKIRLVMAGSYILIILVLYLSFIFAALNNANKWLRNDIRNRENNLISAINADFDMKLVEINALIQNDSLRNPLELSITYAISEFADKLSSSNKNFSKILIADSSNKIIYNSTNVIKGLSGIEAYKSYSCYMYGDKLYRMYYAPVENNNKRIGTIIVLYDLLDFKNAILSSLSDSSYRITGFMDGRIDIFMDKNDIYSVDKPLKSSSWAKLREGFTSFTINGDKSLMLIKSIELNKPRSKYLLSVYASEKQCNSIKLEYLKVSLLQSTITALFISVILLLMGFAAKYFTNKEISNKLEIKNLRAQRHDFIKHLNIINGMAATGEFEDLKTYVECLSSKVVFESTVAKLDNPPVNALIQEKNLEASEKGVKFEVIVKASLRNIRIDPIDLCTVLANLIDNAIEACAKEENADKSVVFETGCEDKQFVFKVSNTGKRIPEKNLNKLFLPGYSTKSGKDRGMGLYIIKQLLKKHNGSIRIESTDELTSFIVYFSE